MLTYRYRPDWPPGSNAKLLARQARSAAGCSNMAAVAPSVLPAGFGKSVIAPATVPAPPPRLTRAREFLALLEDIGRAGEMMPSTYDLLRRLGLSPLSGAVLARMSRELEEDGLIRRRCEGRRKWVELPGLGLVISNVAPPAPIGEAG